MEREHFDAQMKRLRGQWPSSYGDERTARLWLHFQKMKGDVFAAIVDLAIDRMRQAPLADDFAKLEQEVQNRKASGRAYDEFARAGIGTALDNAARVNQKADKDFVKACQQLLREFQTGKITKDQFLEGCDAIDEFADRINPMGRRRQVLSTYQERTAPREH